MERATTLDVGLVAVETADEIDVLLDVAAPAGAEVGCLRDQVAQAVSLVVRPADSVPAFTLWEDLPVCGVDDGVMIELGDFYAGERRRIALGFQVPGMAELGAAGICELELRWSELPSMMGKVATLAVNANVALGAELTERRR
jgi:Ca-activated chloride channel family protein